MTNYMIDTNNIGNESVYIFEKVLFDIIQRRLVIIIKKPVVFQFLRRTEKYSIGYNVFAISINPNLDAFKSKTDDEKLNYIKNNWKELIKIASAKLYPKDITFTATDQVPLNINYISLLPEKEDNAFFNGMYASSFFMENYPELNYIFVYNGYTLNEFIGYYKLPKKQ